MSNTTEIDDNESDDLECFLASLYIGLARFRLHEIGDIKLWKT